MKTMLWSKAPLGLGLALPLVLLVAIPLGSRGQPGLIDPNFNSRLPVVAASVTALGLQSSGKIVVAGTFTSFPQVNGREYEYAGLARLNPDGTVDVTFGRFGDTGISAMAVQPDGKILVGGMWQNTNATKRANICRLNPEGSIDSTFDPGPGTDWEPPPTEPTMTPFSSAIRTIAVQPDGQILLGGDFHEVAGESRPALARLNPNGSIDPTFHPPTRSGDAGLQVLVRPDRKLLVSVGFAGVYPPGVSAGLFGLNPDGTVDTGFQQSPEIRSTPVTVQRNGQILAALRPATVPGLADPIPLIRLNADGSRDPSFSATLVLTNVAKPYPQLFALVSAPGGKCIVLGRFNRVNGIAQNDLARLNADGSLDATFAGGSGFEPPVNLFVRVNAALLQSDGNILFGGMFSKVNGVPCQSLARVLGDPPPRFDHARLSTDGTLLTSLSAVAGETVFLESSPDLKNWTRVAAPAENSAEIRLSRPVDAGPALFYRATAE